MTKRSGCRNSGRPSRLPARIDVVQARWARGAVARWRGRAGAELGAVLAAAWEAEEAVAEEAEWFVASSSACCTAASVELGAPERGEVFE